MFYKAFFFGSMLTLSLGASIGAANALLRTDYPPIVETMQMVHPEVEKAVILEEIVEPVVDHATGQLIAEIERLEAMINHQANQLKELATKQSETNNSTQKAVDLPSVEEHETNIEGHDKYDYEVMTSVYDEIASDKLSLAFYQRHMYRYHWERAIKQELIPRVSKVASHKEALRLGQLAYAVGDRDEAGIRLVQALVIWEDKHGNESANFILDSFMSTILMSGVVEHEALHNLPIWFVITEGMPGAGIITDNRIPRECQLSDSCI